MKGLKAKRIRFIFSELSLQTEMWVNGWLKNGEIITVGSCLRAGRHFNFESRLLKWYVSSGGAWEQ